MATIRRKERHLMSQESYDQLPTILKDRSKVCVIVRKGTERKEATPSFGKIVGTMK